MFHKVYNVVSEMVLVALVFAIFCFDIKNAYDTRDTGYREVRVFAHDTVVVETCRAKTIIEHCIDTVLAHDTVPVYKAVSEIRLL